MALVAYDYDSTSENEDDDLDTDKNNVISNLNVEINNVWPKKEIGSEMAVPNIDLFSKLPETKSHTKHITEDQIEDFVPKSNIKEKPKVKITIPALSEFSDIDEEPLTKKLKSSVKGCGLMSLLPPVKGSVLTTKSFVPNSVAIKNQSNVTATNSKLTNSLIPNVIRKQAETKKSLLLKKIQQKEAKHDSSSDVESDDDIEMPETFDDEMWEKVCGRRTPKKTIKVLEEPVPEQVVNSAPEPETPYEGLDNKAFKELVGKSKRPVGNIKLIDINEEEILPEKDIWMTKSLTDPEMAPKPQIDDPVDPTRRKKHHITYLAQQAKANEQELQNAWSASKNNRMATRAKYGF